MGDGRQNRREVRSGRQQVCPGPARNWASIRATGASRWAVCRRAGGCVQVGWGAGSACLTRSPHVASMLRGRAVMSCATSSSAADSGKVCRAGSQGAFDKMRMKWGCPRPTGWAAQGRISRAFVFLGSRVDPTAPSKDAARTGITCLPHAVARFSCQFLDSCLWQHFSCVGVPAFPILISAPTWRAHLSRFCATSCQGSSASTPATHWTASSHPPLR